MDMEAEHKRYDRSDWKKPNWTITAGLWRDVPLSGKLRDGGKWDAWIVVGYPFKLFGEQVVMTSVEARELASRLVAMADRLDTGDVQWGLYPANAETKVQGSRPLQPINQCKER